MGYEKAYKEALERAKKLYEQGTITECLNYIFPELAESEDEKIRNQIINFIEDYGNPIHCEWQKDWIAWLEKQGEKPQGKSALEAIKEEKVDNANRVEPKFKTGDWICNGRGNPCKVNYIFCNYYELCSTEGYEYTKPIRDIDANYHLWSIQDAKYGDVLYSPCCKLIWLYKDEKTCYVGNNLNYHSDSIVVNNPICIPTDARPATKEQRDTLFARMKEAGYVWDAEKKELKKIKEIMEE